MTIKCSECGRFCIPVDEGTFYGSYYDFEEPDPSFFCSKCYKERLEVATITPEKIIVGCWWRKPKYVRIAKSVLRHKRKGLPK